MVLSKAWATRQQATNEWIRRFGSCVWEVGQSGNSSKMAFEFVLQKRPDSSMRLQNDKLTYHFRYNSI